MDTTWSDLLWGLRGGDDLIDDEFLRYVEFITEVCEWREGRTDGAGQHLSRGGRAQRDPGGGERRPRLGQRLREADLAVAADRVPNVALLPSRFAPHLGGVEELSRRLAIELRSSRKSHSA